MNRKNKIFKIVTLLVMLTMFLSAILPIHNAVTAQAAAKIKLSEKTLILSPGDTDILQVKGTKKKATWTSSESTIVTVSNKGIVVAVNEGKAVITAQVNNKKLTCIIVVMRPENPYVGTAPFAAQEKSFGKISAVIPKDWTCTIDGASVAKEIKTSIYPSTTNTSNDYSDIYIDIEKLSTSALPYLTLKSNCEEFYTIDQIKKDYADEGYELSVTKPVISDVETTLGTACKIEFECTYKKGTEEYLEKYTKYEIQFDSYYIYISIRNIGDNVTPDMNKVAEYFLNSVQVNK